MKGQVRVRASIPALGAAVLLIACASKGPVDSAQIASKGTEADASSEYQSLVDNASKQLVCRRYAMTGSRIVKHQVCLTRAQMDEQREQAVELMRDMQARGALVQPMPDRPAGMPSSPAPATP